MTPSPPLLIITQLDATGITQFITQFITQIPLLKSLLIITQMPFSLLIITPPLLKGHFADGREAMAVAVAAAAAAMPPASRRRISKVPFE